jgi:hypothetical protein
MKKSQLLKILQAMPGEFAVDELIEKLRVLQKIEEAPKRYQRRFGSAAGKYKMAPDFNELPDDFAAYT